METFSTRLAINVGPLDIERALQALHFPALQFGLPGPGPPASFANLRRGEPLLRSATFEHLLKDCASH
jgi:hypothetical protein